ncbi:hypothetical protein AX17_003311 [Amanita inopinata Kibby_2008]|nr:hypothetical protein AX17_003311 [Amanita inopinata Kibby_2008]
MLHDGRPVPLSPSKGKAREETRWRTGWWDFYPLAEQSQRPLEWSESCFIFSPHPTRPEVTARHFSSSKQFVIPPPAPVSSSPALYSPPTFISVSPGERFVFVYYPGKASDGVGCIWRRESRLDDWLSLGWWKFAQDARPLAADWLGSPRLARSSMRLPPRGPRTLITYPTLLYITSDHRAHVCYLRHYVSSLKVISCSLDQADVASEITQSDEVINYPVKRCVLAAIGLAYNESSVLVATRVRYLPTKFSRDPQLNSLGLDVSVNINEPAPPEPNVFNWEVWGEESSIHICELKLEFDGALMSLHTNPLPPILHTNHSLTKLCLIPLLRNSPNVISATTQSDSNNSPTFYMVASHLDFGDYTSTPKSEISVYSLFKSSASVTREADQVPWNVRQEAKRGFYPEVLCFIIPVDSGSANPLLYVGTVKTSGSIPTRSKSRRAEVGVIKVLKLSDLKEDEHWQSSSISSTVDQLGRELPLAATISPNGVLVTTASPWLPHASVHCLPKKSLKLDSSIPHYSILLASAILLGKSTADITHVLSPPSVPLNKVIDILYRAVQLLDKLDNGIPYSRTASFLGVVIEIYMNKARHLSLEDERDNLGIKIRVLFSILTLKVFNEIFEQCREEDGNAELQSAWQLIELSEYIVHFVENLMRECVLWHDPVREESNSSPPILDSPTLLPLAHPYAFKNVCKAVGYVAKLRAYIGSLPAGGERENTAKNVLLDLVDRSGVDFAILQKLLAECLKESTSLDANDCRLSLASCHPVPSMYPLLNTIIHRINESNILNKSMLFIKPRDLVDGAHQFNLGTEKREMNEDVFFKKPLAKQIPGSMCLRCGGMSKLGSDTLRPGVSNKWRTWVKTQMPRCVCYGLCMKATPVLDS